jgi:hypothetical protein
LGGLPIPWKPEKETKPYHRRFAGMQELKNARLHSQAFPEKDIYQMYFLKTYCTNQN